MEVKKTEESKDLKQKPEEKAKVKSKTKTGKKEKIKNEPVKEKFSKTKRFFKNKNVRLAIVGIFILAIAFLVQYFVNKPNLGVYLSSDMDPSGNVYMLSVSEKKGNYFITKISKNGSTDFKIDLEKSNDQYEYTYSDLESDSKGNFYFVKRSKKLDNVSNGRDTLPLTSETVMMYDTDGNYIKQVVNFDFSKDANPPYGSYIRKIQFIDQKMNVICAKDDVYDIIAADPVSNSSPTKINSFEIRPPYEVADNTLSVVSDMCVLSGGRVFYATRTGELWGMNNQGEFMEYSNAVSTSDFVLNDMSVDNSDNIYFTDNVSGKFYKFNTKSVTASPVYELGSELVSGSGVLLKDVKPLKCLGDGVFFGASKAFGKVYYVKCGGENRLVTDIRGKFFPWGIVIMLVVAAIIVGLIYLVRYLSGVEIKRIPLAIRIVTMFLPIYLISMAVLVYVNTSDGVDEYMSVLTSEQERGAKTVADHIVGSDFSNLNHIKGYMTPNYLKVKRSIENGYADLMLKIGDRSDYIITYVERYNKLYTTINTEFSEKSSSYSRLKYTKPDMATSQMCLVDSVLERDEAEKIYKIWNDFANKTNETDSLDADFRDVYGNITASFVPIKDENGRVVGLIGNFLDEDIHRNEEFQKIFFHSLSVILIVTIAVFAYLCFVVKICLKPLKTIKRAISEFTKGKWDIRILPESKDELADISEAFNLMSEKISRYTRNLIRLNKEYIRYVPTSVFRLMNKEKITQVDLHDQNVVNMNMLYISFNISCRGSYDFEDEYAVFDALNKSYSKIFKVVKDNHGVVQSFDGLDAVILFPENSIDAFNAAVQFREIDINETIKKHMNIVLGKGDILVGVSGDDERRGVVVVSDEIMQLFNIDTQINFIGIHQVATKAIINELDKSSPYTYRFIGKVGNITGEGATDIYEIIDGTNKYRKDLYMSTLETFEKAIKLYLTAEFEEARDLFTDVLRVNENDKVAVQYLMKCEEQISGSDNGQFKKKFTGFLI